MNAILRNVLVLAGLAIATQAAAHVTFTNAKALQAGGAVAGAAVGANIGRGGQQTGTHDVRHCENVPSQARPDYWDITYNFQGQEHRIQMVAPPGPTVTVNERGEPRE